MSNDDMRFMRAIEVTTKKYRDETCRSIEVRKGIVGIDTDKFDLVTTVANAAYNLMTKVKHPELLEVVPSDNKHSYAIWVRREAIENLMKEKCLPDLDSERKIIEGQLANESGLGYIEITFSAHITPFPVIDDNTPYRFFSMMMELVLNSKK